MISIWSNLVKQADIPYLSISIYPPYQKKISIKHMSIFKRHHQKVTIMYAINKGFTYAIRIFVAQFISRCNNNFHS